MLYTRLTAVIKTNMAACGTAEHNEARRKEVVYLRKSYYQLKRENMARERQHQDLLDQSTGRYTGRQPSTYEIQVERMRQRGMIDNNIDYSLRDKYTSQYDRPNKDFAPRTAQRSSVRYL
ncbi:hypothetical protein LSH36_4g17061 [Paralvinella palmiformis]|uniref:Uncharacterized protein n=1 Tax=Paralvinella palmiformis TaxID=53620 RepID=A0AAD9KF28_9ANNE|nr:hypothetical protein LSH36_4g17061 [Paralvinella palmiformis]